jgi:hypothetical protein
MNSHWIFLFYKGLIFANFRYERFIIDLIGKGMEKWNDVFSAPRQPIG